MSPEKGRLSVSAFFLAQSSHCSLILVFHSGSLSNHRINRLHERCLRIVYNDNYSSLRRLTEYWLSVFQYIAGIYSSLWHGCLGSTRELFLVFLTLSWRRPLSYRGQSIGLGPSHWTGFYMVAASVIRGLMKYFFWIQSHIQLKESTSVCYRDYAYRVI